MAGAFAVALLLQVEIQLVEPAFGGLYRPNQWNLVVVRLRAGAAGWSGDLGVRVENGPESVFPTALVAGVVVTRLLPVYLPSNPGRIQVVAGRAQSVPVAWRIPGDERMVLVFHDSGDSSLRRWEENFIREAPRCDWPPIFWGALDAVDGPGADVQSAFLGARLGRSVADWRRFADGGRPPRIARRRARGGLAALGLFGLLSLGATVLARRWGRSPLRALLPWVAGCAAGGAVAWAFLPPGSLDVRAVHVDIVLKPEKESYDVLLPRVDSRKAAGGAVEWEFPEYAIPLSPPPEAVFRFERGMRATLPPFGAETAWIVPAEFVDRFRALGERVGPDVWERVLDLRGTGRVLRLGRGSGQAPGARCRQAIGIDRVDSLVVYLDEER